MTRKTSKNSYFERLANIVKGTKEEDIRKVADFIKIACNLNKKIFLIGNGGSALNASHFELGLQKEVKYTQSPPFIINPCNNYGMATAWANDFSFEQIFSLPLSLLASRGDVLIVCSVSGCSPNIVSAVNVAKVLKMKVVSVIGKKIRKTVS